MRIPAQTSFWINVFNAGVLRDSPELEFAAGARDVQAFFEQPRLKIGGHAFSLDDVQHGLLRGNVAKQGRLRAPMSRDDPRLAFMPIAFDERMHFALYTAARSSPALRAFDGGSLDRQLEEATARLPAAHRARRGGRRGGGAAAGCSTGTPRTSAASAARSSSRSAALDDAAVDAVDRRQGRVKLQYAEFDWTLNRR